MCYSEEFYYRLAVLKGNGADNWTYSVSKGGNWQVPLDSQVAEVLPGLHVMFEQESCFFGEQFGQECFNL